MDVRIVSHSHARPQLQTDLDRDPDLHLTVLQPKHIAGMSGLARNDSGGQGPDNKPGTPSGGNYEQEDLYRGITIGIVLVGLLLMICLTCYVVRENRREQRRREERKKAAKKAVDTDIPPTYSQIVLRKEPPEYNESVMQQINPEENPHWSEDVAEPEKVPQEIRDIIAAKVQSQAHGMFYKMLGRDTLDELPVVAEINATEQQAQRLQQSDIPRTTETTEDSAEPAQEEVTRSETHPTFVVGEDNVSQQV